MHTFRKRRFFVRGVNTTLLPGCGGYHVWNEENMFQGREGGREGRIHRVTIVEARTRKGVREVRMSVTYKSACQDFCYTHPMAKPDHGRNEGVLHSVLI